MQKGKFAPTYRFPAINQGNFYLKAFTQNLKKKLKVKAKSQNRRVEAKVLSWQWEEMVTAIRP